MITRRFPKFPLLVLIAAVLGVAAGQKPLGIPGLVRLPEDPGGIIQLPIRFHIVQGIEMSKKGVTMDMWLTPEDVEETILPEINRIWRPAGIQWVIERIAVEESVNRPGRDKILRDIAAATRETPGRTRKILSLLDPISRHPVVHNLTFVPFVGATTQGFGSFGGSTAVDSNPDGGNRGVVCVWTDKPSDATEPPRRFPLREEPPFKIGSIARTCAHELGHNLLLQHPDKETQTEFDRLMGGKRHGYRFTPEEIALARRVARARAESILEWTE